MAHGATAAPAPDITISDAQVTEGDGPTTMTFVVTRRPPLLGAGAVTIGYQTADGTARAPGDYTAAQGSLSFPTPLLGQVQTRTITITITGDTIFELPESFSVTLSGPELARPTGTGTILDNDPLFPPPPGRSASTTGVDEQLIARTPAGGVPDAAATEPVLTGDARNARYAAYTSAATDIAPPASARRNVYLVKRGGLIGALGTPWQYGSTVLASAGRGGQPANGDSFAPALDGWTQGDTAHGPTCLAFASEASNLVAGDGDGRADAFVRKLHGGKLTRIQAPAAVSDVAVAGDCHTIAVVAGGALYASRRGAKKLRRIARGGVSAPDLTFNGRQISYGRGAKVFVRRISGHAKAVADGVDPTSDGGRPAGKIRAVAYERAGSSYISGVGGGERLISAGSLPSMTAGGTQVLFASGPYIYLYAVSNSFGKQKPVAFCPPGEGSVTSLYASSRGNYVVFSCAGGAAYLAFLGGR